MKSCRPFTQVAFCLISLSLFATTLMGCGAGESTINIEEVSQSALSLLGAGDIPGAQADFDTILRVDENNANAAFGAAFTRLLLLVESDPSQKILADLGQPAAKLSNIVGPTSYLAALNEINSVTASLDTFTAPFHAVSQANSFSYFQFPDANCVQRNQEIHFVDVSGNRDLRISIITSFELDDGTILSQLNQGDIISIFQMFPASDCNSEIPIVFISLETPDKFFSPGELSSGTIQLNKIGKTLGDPVDLNFDHIVLQAFDNTTVTINGSLQDQITLSFPTASTFFPFAATPDENFLDSESLIFRKAPDSTTVTTVQTHLAGYIPLFEEIQDLLKIADQSDAFQFTIPQGLYFGHEDIHINRVDLKLIRGSIDMTLAGLFFADSWECPMQIGDIYNAAGERVVSKQEIVDRLNECFNLKSDNSLPEAKVSITSGFQNLLDASDIRTSISVDGIVENDPLEPAGYAELTDLVATLRDSLDSEQNFSFLAPPLTISLENLFLTPPNAANIDVDPFVLEGNNIKLVEAFVDQALNGIADFHLSQNYTKNFQALDNDFFDHVFDEFMIFFVSGEKIGFNRF